MTLVFILVIFSCLGESVCWAQSVNEPHHIAVINIPTAQETSPIQQPAAPSTVTLGPLVARNEDQAWLSKAVADLIIQNLSEVRSLAILEREKMQAFSEEVGLKDSALFNQEKALRVGRVAKADQVIYGNYLLKGNTITVTIFLMDLQTQHIVRQEKISGPFAQLRSLMKQLVLQFLAAEQIPLSEDEKQRLQFEVTDSMTATEHFYRGIDFYDQGQYPEAFGEFLKAARQDSRYLEAHLWVGRMFEAQMFYEHAVLAYENIYNRHSETVEARDALACAAKIFEFKLYIVNETIGLYQKLAQIKPVSPHSLDASFRLGELYYRQGQYLLAFQEFEKIDTFRQKYIEDPLLFSRTDVRTSRFIHWQQALNLYKESIVKMISLYEKLIIQLQSENLPPPPRGVIVLSPENPQFKEMKFGHTESLFPKEQIHPDWREDLYVVMISKGYWANGLTFSVTGEMPNPNPGYDYTFRVLPFPLPRDFDRHWLGVIFGQTSQKTTLTKTVSFHGENRNVFTLQLLENHSTIFDWSIDVDLEKIPDESTRVYFNDVGGIFWEGMPIVKIPLKVNRSTKSTRLLQQEWYRPKKELDILFDPIKGHFLVTAQGDLDGEQTDLWLSRNVDGEEWYEMKWSDLQRLNINSSAEDFNPRLIRAEDGKLWLAWISNRRGKGWELWVSQWTNGFNWASPMRIPLEKFDDPGMEKRLHNLANDLLEYDIYQDNRGQWIAAYYSYDSGAMIFIKSKDLREWELSASIPAGEVFYGASLIQDSSGVYRLGFMGKGGKVHLWSSNDAKEWSKKEFMIPFWSQSYASSPMLHRTRLFPLELGKILMLVSDDQYGLQFAKFQADTQEPVPDLVTRADLQAYAVTRTSPNEYLVALKDDEKITLRQYQNFNVSGKEIEKDTRGFPIYREVENDADGNEWTRIFAQTRRRVSDVTSLGLEPSGRLWWGIESGIMYKHGEQFYATDVSLGFFYHFITDIEGCSDNRTWFVSKYLNKPELGFVQNLPTHAKTLTQLPPRFQTVIVPGITGPITAVACGTEKNEIYVGTSYGKVVGFNGSEIFYEKTLPTESYITALAVDPGNGDVWVGTQRDGIYRLTKDSSLQNKPGSHINDIVFDREGHVWISIANGGLMRLKGEQSTQYTPENSGILYWSSDHLAADPVKGIWYLPADDTASKGLGYFDGEKAVTYNPPHQILPSSSSLVVEPSGDVWIGTWFDGLYKLKRKGGGS